MPNAWLSRFAPQMSETERQALEAGDTWIDAALFSGKPDLAAILREPYSELSEREQEFLDGPVEEVCRLVEDWDVYCKRDLPEHVWAYLRENGFFGMTVPRESGGLEFSALGIGSVIGKLATRSMPLATVVMVPNSLGPAELIASHGTPDQKRLLPRLASGEEVPCFALTEPEAGSDAGSMTSEGTVFCDDDGELRIRLQFDKRYITLAPVATLIGLAVRLVDPEEHLGRGTDVGITCVLVPASAEGIEVGRRHDAMGVPFPTGPIHGRDVIVSVHDIIGGVEQAGRGWGMLMEALSAGRSITLPGQAAGGVRILARVAGAYAAVRRQFGMPIGRFAGIEEPLARIGGLTYLMDAARVFTCSALDAGHRPSVISAIVKYQQTELARGLASDGMDVLAGAGLCRGPRNLLAHGYAGAAIPITVEGANILTRTLIIFGQGAVRCHPRLRGLMEALSEGSTSRFTRVVAGFVLRFVATGAREKLLSLTRGYLAGSPVGGPTARYYRRVSWAAARFALLTDLALMGIGPQLKRRGRLTGRYADALSWMYLTLCALRRFEAEGRRKEDLPLVQWATEYGLYQVQLAFEGILANLNPPLLGWFCRGPWAWWVRLNPIGRPPSDALGARVARILQTPGEQRERLCAQTFVPEGTDEALGRLEDALRRAVETASALDLVRRAMRKGKLPAESVEDAFAQAEAEGVIEPGEAAKLREAAAARRAVIEVDSFPLQEYLDPAGLAAAAETAAPA